MISNLATVMDTDRSTVKYFITDAELEAILHTHRRTDTETHRTRKKCLLPQR